MGIAGWILFTLGVVSIVLGLVLGAKDVFQRQSQPGAQAALPTQFLEVLKKLLDAPPAKFFTGVGLILVLLGLALNGVEVFGSGAKAIEGQSSS